MKISSLERSKYSLPKFSHAFETLWKFLIPDCELNEILEENSDDDEEKTWGSFVHRKSKSLIMNAP